MIYFKNNKYYVSIGNRMYAEVIPFIIDDDIDLKTTSNYVEFDNTPNAMSLLQIKQILINKKNNKYKK